MKAIGSLVFILWIISATAQRIDTLASNNKSSLRGLSVVSDQIIWVSGTNGNIGRSTDAGKTWNWVIVPGFEKRDFRDIEAFSALEAVIMAVDEPGQILRTTDGGAHWKIVFTDTCKGMFLDAMYFSKNNGIVAGDPIDHRIYLLRSRNRGKSWSKSTILDRYTLPEGEAFFAASGTNIAFLPASPSLPVLVTGGKRSRLYFSDTADYDLPLDQGANSTGANSIAFSKGKPEGIIVGGDFLHDTISRGNCVLFSLAPHSFKTPDIPPHGYRSCVIQIENEKWICCGTSGVDISTDGGNTWKLISHSGFNVCQKANDGKIVYLAGAKGKLAKLVW